MDGSTLVTHTADCAECDFRIAKVQRGEFDGEEDALEAWQVPAGDEPRALALSADERSVLSASDGRALYSTSPGSYFGESVITGRRRSALTSLPPAGPRRDDSRYGRES